MGFFKRNATKSLSILKEELLAAGGKESLESQMQIMLK